MDLPRRPFRFVLTLRARVSVPRASPRVEQFSEQALFVLFGALPKAVFQGIQHFFALFA